MCLRPILISRQPIVAGLTLPQMASRFLESLAVELVICSLSMHDIASLSFIPTSSSTHWWRLWGDLTLGCKPARTGIFGSVLPGLAPSLEQCERSLQPIEFGQVPLHAMVG